MPRFLFALAFLPLVATVTSAADDRFPFPANYREWVFLSSGVDMSYTPNAAPSGTNTIFDNVFVNPEAYRAFLETGTWPDKTTLVLEVRASSSKGSINQRGFFQAPEVRGIELHVKDKARFPDGWAFVGFDSQGRGGKTIPHSADCYSCHADHGAVDTTFVQFYPTLLHTAASKGTLLKQ